MFMKQYRNTSVREALRAVKADLGPTALVLSTEMVAARGWRGWLGVREVQLTAAIDRVSEAKPPAPESRTADTRPAKKRPATDPLRGELVARLVACGLDRPLAEAVAAGIPDDDCRTTSMLGIRRALAAQLASLAAGDEPFARAEVFIGPPGVGKTTTIAKIAARERAQRGQLLGMVAADGFRAGAVEQLRTYADIIGAPFRVARSAVELKAALDTKQTVLVDTAGRSPRDPAVRDVLELLAKRRHVRTHLVMAADTSVSAARRIFDLYDEARPERLVVTKLDEADSIAPLLGLIRERRLPVSYIATGQQIPEDLDRATPALLAGAVLAETPLRQESGI
jgi:flagellar biosynthesis protein FlhF